MSDLHLGALNSVLSAVSEDGERVDPARHSPVMEALGDCLRALHVPGQDPPQLVVLGDLFELALSPTESAAATFADLVGALRPGASDAAVSAEMRFVPGNHDHHLWSRARDDHFVVGLASPGGPSGSLPPSPHTTPLLPAQGRHVVRDRFTELLAARAGGTRMSVTQSYPNLGLVADGGRRAVVLSHGHFVEPLYRLMTELDDVFGSGLAAPADAERLEADNAGWIDFFWSSMGDSGNVDHVVRSLYESLQSERAIDAEISIVRRAIAGRASARQIRARLEGLVAAGLLRSATDALHRERHRSSTVLSARAEEGLTAYLQGAVAGQLAHEVDGAREVAFVFGHTHKPFCDHRTVERLPGPVQVVNTGGWVVDTPEPDPVKGASVVLLDDDLHVAVLGCYTQGPPGSPCEVRVVDPGGGEPNPLAESLSELVDRTRDPWRTMAEAAAAVSAERHRQLGQRLRSIGAEPGEAAGGAGRV